MRERLEKSLRASTITMEGHFLACMKSKSLEDLALLAYYAGRVSSTAGILAKEYGDKGARLAMQSAWGRVLDAIEEMEGK